MASERQLLAVRAMGALCSLFLLTGCASKQAPGLGVYPVYLDSTGDKSSTVAPDFLADHEEYERGESTLEDLRLEAYLLRHFFESDELKSLPEGHPFDPHLYFIKQLAEVHEQIGEMEEEAQRARHQEETSEQSRSDAAHGQADGKPDFEASRRARCIAQHYYGMIKRDYKHIDEYLMLMSRSNQLQEITGPCSEEEMRPPSADDMSRELFGQ